MENLVEAFLESALGVDGSVPSNFPRVIPRLAAATSRAMSVKFPSWSLPHAEPTGTSRSLVVQSQRPKLSTNKIPFRFPFSLTLNSVAVGYANDPF